MCLHCMEFTNSAIASESLSKIHCNALNVTFHGITICNYIIVTVYNGKSSLEKIVKHCLSALQKEVLIFTSQSLHVSYCVHVCTTSSFRGDTKNAKFAPCKKFPANISMRWFAWVVPSLIYNCKSPVPISTDFIMA